MIKKVYKDCQLQNMIHSMNKESKNKRLQIKLSQKISGPIRMGLQIEFAHLA